MLRSDGGGMLNLFALMHTLSPPSLPVQVGTSTLRSDGGGMLNLFGSDDEGNEEEDEDDDDRPGGGKKGGRRGGGRRGGAGAKGGRRGGRGKAGGEAEGDDEDAPDDNYEGEQDELRPEKPEPAEDWEHEQV